MGISRMMAQQVQQSEEAMQSLGKTALTTTPAEFPLPRFPLHPLWLMCLLHRLDLACDGCLSLLVFLVVPDHLSLPPAPHALSQGLLWAATPALSWMWLLLGCRDGPWG